MLEICVQFDHIQNPDIIMKKNIYIFKGFTAYNVATPQKYNIHELIGNIHKYFTNM